MGRGGLLEWSLSGGLSGIGFCCIVFMVDDGL